MTEVTNVPEYASCPSYKLPDTRANREKLIELASMLRQLFELPQYKEAAHYSGLISALCDAHDEAAKHPRGSPENRRAYAEAVKVYGRARVYAFEHGFDEPNGILRAMGYAV